MVVVTNFPDEFDENTGDGRWKYEEVLGEGGFGVVHAALDRKNADRKVAIKILRCGKDPYRHCLLGTKEVRQARLFEEKVFSQTKHRLFLRYLEDHTGLDKYSNDELKVFDRPDFDWDHDPRLKALTVNTAPYLVMEFIPGRNVKMLLKEKCLNLEEIRELMHQAAAALWHMSQQKKIHRDFRVHNMMWNAGELTIIDFGLVLGVEPEHSHSKNRLIRTYWKLDSYWMPPEVKLALGRSSSKEQIANFVPCNFPELCPFAFDMYSFGVVALELLLDHQVNARMARNQNAIEQKGLKRLRPHDAVKYLDETRLKGVGLTRAIIQCCVSKNPSFRLTPVSLLQGFQSNFQTSKVAPKGHAQFMKKLEASCGKSRQDDGMRHLGHLAREIITKINYVDQYAQALITFCEKPGVSIYRLLCIVDCAARFGGKIKDKNNLELLVAAFTPFIYRFAKQSKIVYETDSPSNKFNRLRVSEFLKKWSDRGLFPNWESYSDANKAVKQEVEENEKDKDKKVTSVSTHVPTTAHSGDLSSAQSFEVNKKPTTTKKTVARKPAASPPAKVKKSAAADEDSEEEGILMSELAMARTLVDDDDIFNFMSKPAAPAPVAKIVVEDENEEDKKDDDDAMSSKGFADDDDEDLDKAPSVASDDHFSQMSISDMTVASPNDNDDDAQMIEEIEESAVQEVLESGEDDDEVEFLQENGEVISDDDEEEEEEEAEEISWQSDASIKHGGKIIRKRGASVQEIESDDEESEEELQILAKSKKKISRIAAKPKKKKAAVSTKTKKKEKKKKAPKRSVVQRAEESDDEPSEASSSSGRRVRRPLPQEVDSSDGEEESSDIGMRPVVPRRQMIRRSRTPPAHRSLSRSRSPPPARRPIRGFSDSPGPRYQTRRQRFRNEFNDSGRYDPYHIPRENRPPPTRRMPPPTRGPRGGGANIGNGGRYAAGRISPMGRGGGGRSLSPFIGRHDGPRRGNAAGVERSRIQLVPREASPQRGYYGGGFGSHSGYAQRVINERIIKPHDYVQQGMFPMFPENSMAYTTTIPVARRGGDHSWQDKRNNKQWNLGIPWNRT